MSGGNSAQSPFGGTAVPVLLVDRQGRIRSASPGAESIFGASAGQMSELSLDTVLSPRNPDWMWHEIRTHASRSSWIGDVVFRRLDGQEYWAHIQACSAPAGVSERGDLMLIVEDVSDRMGLAEALMRQSETLYKRNRELEVVSNLGTLLLSKSDLNSRLHMALREATKTIGADCGLIALKNRAGSHLRCAAVYGKIDGDFVMKQAIALSDQSLMAHTIRTRKPYIAEDLSKEKTVMRSLVQRSNLTSALYVPILVEGRSLGVLVLGTRCRRAFSAEDVTLAQITANLTAGAIRSSTIGDEFSRAARLAAAGELLAGAAHNIGNALMAVRGSLELAKMMGTDCGTSQTVLDRIDQAIAHLGSGTDIVLRLTDFARGGIATPRPISLKGLAQSAVDLCGTHPAACERTVRNLVPFELPQVQARPGPLLEVLFNLLVNGLQATPPGGEVRIEAEPADEGLIELSISDNGCGMSGEVLERAFEPFYSTKGGTGLGLSSSATIVQEMGGAISIDSATGEGATFRIRLSIASSRSADQAAA